MLGALRDALLKRQGQTAIQQPSDHVAALASIGSPHQAVPGTMLPPNIGGGGVPMAGHPLTQGGMHPAVMEMAKQNVKDHLKRVRHQELRNELGDIHQKRSRDIDSEQEDLFKA